MESRAESGAERRSAGQLRLPASQSALGPARRYVEEMCSTFGFDADGSYELAFAVNEAVTNAVKHGRGDRDGLISLRAFADADHLTFVVHDYGTFAAPSLDTDASLEHGRGLALMINFADEIRVSAKPGNTVVYLSKARV